MPLTPAEIHNMEFRKASLGKRGYDDEQVDAFLDEATREMIRLLEDNDLLQRRLDAADAATDPAPAARSAGELEFAAVTADLDRARIRDVHRRSDRRRHRNRLGSGRLRENNVAARQHGARDERRPVEQSGGRHGADVTAQSSE